MVSSGKSSFAKIFSFPIFRSIRGKVGFLVGFLLLLVFGISGYISFRESISDLKAQLEQNALAFAELSTRPLVESFDLYYDSGFFTFRRVVADILALNTDIEKVQIVDVNGVIVFDSSQELGTDKWEGPERRVGDDLLAAIISSEQSVIRDPQDPGMIAEIIQPFFTDWGAHRHSVRYFVSYQRINESTRDIVLEILILTPLLILGSYLLLFFGVDRFLLTPIAKLKMGTEKIGAGDYAYNIEVKTGDEMELLADSFNEMKRRVAKSIEDLKELDRIKSEFIAIASHNLRTPLTVIKGALEGFELMGGQITVGQVRYLAMLKKSIGKLEAIIRTLLDVVSLESGRPALSYEEFNFCALVEESLGDYSSGIAAKKIKLDIKCDPTCEKVFLGKELTYQLLGILLDNAVKFNKENGSVTVEAKVVKEVLKVCITDTGLGISEEEKKLVFTKFHRATDILRYDYEGIGLGLYVSRLIAQVYGGKVYLKESTLGKGSTFCFELPMGKREKGEVKSEK